MKLGELLITLPYNSQVYVWKDGGEKEINNLTYFLAKCEYRHLVVKSVIPGKILIVGCRTPKKRRVRHVTKATAPALVKLIPKRSGVKRQAPAAVLHGAAVYKIRPLTDQEFNELFDYNKKVEREAFLEGDIYRSILRKGGIQPSSCYRGEYRDTVPIGLRNKHGLSLDEMADELGLDVSEMLEQIRSRKIVA